MKKGTFIYLTGAENNNIVVVRKKHIQSMERCNGALSGVAKINYTVIRTKKKIMWYVNETVEDIIRKLDDE